MGAIRQIDQIFIKICIDMILENINCVSHIYMLQLLSKGSKQSGQNASNISCINTHVIQFTGSAHTSKTIQT